MTRKKPRKKLFIDLTVQGSIVRRIMYHWVIALGVLSMVLLMMQVLLDGAYQSLWHYVTVTWQHYGLLLITLACLFPVFAYDAVKLSHRFAGPIVSFRRHLQAVASGAEVAPLSFRKTDFWQPLADDLNRVSERVHDLEAQLKQASQQQEPVEV